MNAIPPDSHLQDLAIYLRDGLNDLGDRPVVEAVSLVTRFSDLDKFPLLQIYRIGGTKYGADKTQQIAIGYYINSFADQYDIPALLYWVVEAGIVELLVQYYTASECDHLDLDSLQWNYMDGILQNTPMTGAIVKFTLL